jgi:hypothetical protein
MKLSRRTATAATLAVLALGGTLAATTPASAATTAAYNGVCGSGYKVIDSTPIGNVGTTYVTWNESKGWNCVVTIRNTPGAPVYMSASLQVLLDHESTPAVDNGQFTTYAGPVYREARGYCIEWGGVIGKASAYDSGHCGG